MTELDLCDVNVTTQIWIDLSQSSKNESESEVGEMPIEFYQYLCPPLIIASFLSVILNSALFIVGHLHTHNKSPVLRLSLNLASTDTLASLLTGLGIIFNSYLPVVYGISLSRCFFLVFEVFRTAALIASVLHLLALACIHYKGIVNPLHYRSITFCSSHVSTSIHFITCICWIFPLFIFTVYFFSIPCQGFRSPTCSVEFFLLFNYRFLILVCFMAPLVIMLGLYTKIFFLIKKHETERSVLSAVPSLDTNSISKTTSHIVVKQQLSNNNNQCNWIRNVLRSPAGVNGRRNPTEVIFEVNKEVRSFADSNSNPDTQSDVPEKSNKRQYLQVTSQGSSFNRSSPGPNSSFASVSTHWKALSTTLIVLGTYLICWMPAVLFLALTCIDGCPFPLGQISSQSRLLAGFVCNSLVILKAIVDPFIYTLRMADVKLALKKCAGIDRRNRQKSARNLALSRSLEDTKSDRKP